MTDGDQAAAQARADALNRALAPGADHRWIAHHAGAGWEVARVSVAGLPPRIAETHGERGPERDDAPDPRTTLQRLIPPYGPN